MISITFYLNSDLFYLLNSFVFLLFQYFVNYYSVNSEKKDLKIN